MTKLFLMWNGKPRPLFRGHRGFVMKFKQKAHFGLFWKLRKKINLFTFFFKHTKKNKKIER
mgnify:CR=1 FL=1